MAHDVITHGGSLMHTVRYADANRCVAALCCVPPGLSVSVILVMSLKLIVSSKRSDMSRAAHGVPSCACKWIPSPRLPTRRGRTGATGQTEQRLTCDIQHTVLNEIVLQNVWLLGQAICVRDLWRKPDTKTEAQTSIMNQDSSINQI